MNILFAVSEAVPLAKSGGLADVAGALPRSLSKLGVDARIIMPKYGDISYEQISGFERTAEFTVGFGWRNQYCGLLRGEVDGVIYYLIDNEYYFKRNGLYGYDDDAERFVFFCFAVMEAARWLDFHPDICHCHDWQTGLIPFLLKTRYTNDPAWAGTRSVFTIHNLMYQGLTGIQQMKDLIGTGDEHFSYNGLEDRGAASCMKGGLNYADKLTTVSQSYAQEIQTAYYGEGLDSLLRYRTFDLTGIVNGIDYDHFDPMRDPAISYPYRHSLNRKRKNKLELQQELGLPAAGHIPLIGIVSRLVEQKGFDLIAATLDEVLQDEVQFVVLGAGEHRYEQLFVDAARRYPDKVFVWLGYNDRLARRIYAGSDMFVMPSKFEPCGLSQLIALRYLSVPIVRETGGLRDTVQPYNELTGEGTGFTFTNYNAHDFMYTLRRAISFYKDREAWNKVVANGTKEDFSWERSAKSYNAIYTSLTAQRKENDQWRVI